MLSPPTPADPEVAGLNAAAVAPVRRVPPRAVISAAPVLTGAFAGRLRLSVSGAEKVCTRPVSVYCVRKEQFRVELFPVGKETAPGPQKQRFAAYIEGLAEAAGHADRHAPLKNYCTGLLLPGERKSVEPMAARLAVDNVGRMHQSLHHVVADAPWSDEAVLDRCLDCVIPAMLRHDPVLAWGGG